MDSSTRLLKVHLLHTKKIRSVRLSHFLTYKSDILPGAEVMLDDTKERWERARSHSSKLRRNNYTRIYCSSHWVLWKRWVSKKKKADPNVLRSFGNLCQFKECSYAIDCEYNSLVKRGTWSYIKRKADMKPVPYTWLFKQKPLDAEGKKFIDQARYCVQLVSSRRLWYFHNHGTAQRILPKFKLNLIMSARYTSLFMEPTKQEKYRLHCWTRCSRNESQAF